VCAAAVSTEISKAEGEDDAGNGELDAAEEEPSEVRRDLSGDLDAAEEEHDGGGLDRVRSESDANRTLSAEEEEKKEVGWPHGSASGCKVGEEDDDADEYAAEEEDEEEDEEEEEEEEDREEEGDEELVGDGFLSAARGRHSGECSPVVVVDEAPCKAEAEAACTRRGGDGLRAEVHVAAPAEASTTDSVRWKKSGGIWTLRRGCANTIEEVGDSVEESGGRLEMEMSEFSGLQTNPSTSIWRVDACSRA
jgi:hypothetical protein